MQEETNELEENIDESASASLAFNGIKEMTS